MARDRQAQEAGDHSQQLQVAGDLHIHQGITEERANEIAETRARAVVLEYTAEAQELVAARIDAFDRRMVAALSAANQLKHLKDPSFLALLRKAQIGAASTDREADLDMLASLLSDRAERGGKRTISASIDRAVEVIDLLDSAALSGLTLTLAVGQYTAMAGLVSFGLDTLNQLFTQLVDDELPIGEEWLEHLETLDAVRITGDLYALNKLGTIYSNGMPGYVTIGLPAEGAATVQAEAQEESPHFPWNVVPHDLKPGFVRLPFVSSRAIKQQLMNLAPVTQDMLDTIERVAVEKFHVDTSDPGLTPRLVEEIDKRPALKAVQKWWDGIPTSFKLTGVGKVLARANAQRRDTLGLLPPLD